MIKCPSPTPVPPAVQLRKDTYSRLTPIQKLQVARHPNRPTFLDIALNITDKVRRCGAGAQALLRGGPSPGLAGDLPCCHAPDPCMPLASQPVTGLKRPFGLRGGTCPCRPSSPVPGAPPAAARQFVELHGDRGGLDDPAMVCGLGSIDGVSFMFIGHQKGRNTKVRGRAGRALQPAVRGARARAP